MPTAPVVLTRARRLEIVDGVLALLADPAHWTRKAMARDAADEAVAAADPAAVCWCLAGAFDRVDPTQSLWGDAVFLQAARAVLPMAVPDWVRQNPGAGLVIFNDRFATRHAELLEVLRTLRDALATTPDD